MDSGRDHGDLRVLSVAELSAAIPKTGGDYIYLREAYGPLPAFLSGWVSFLIGFALPSAASAFAFAKYMVAPLDLAPEQSVYFEQALATAAVLIFAPFTYPAEHIPPGFRARSHL